MKNYIGIDLGTTNSAICSYDGKETRIWKSPEQNDVTPSAIFVDKRGNRYYGTKAYNQAPYNPNNSAVLFKRFMGTNTKIELESSNISLTPEECSAEILKVLFGYLPEEIKNDPETATVITVPAAFNQMKKDATLQAAKLAGIGRVALMQEPVAAIMSVVRNLNQNGIFLIYDLGGGTFDVSIGENINGKVNLLAHGGIEMCGGRDIDRMIFSDVIVPWLFENFELPEDFLINRKYKTFCRVAQWAAEQAKIELSSVESATIALSEVEARMQDESGEELYIDIDIDRTLVNGLMEDLLNETISTTKEIISKAGLTANDFEKIVFIGGPTNYTPLRNKVAFELAIPARIDVNPMTAVAEGASIFAESIDWESNTRHRKPTNKIANTCISLSFRYTSRTSADSAKILCVCNDELQGYKVQFTCLNTGWISGQVSLTDGLMVSVPLAENGENHFKVEVYDSMGRTVSIGESELIITKTLATIGAIPASNSIGIEVSEKIGGKTILEFLVNEGDALPKKGSITFKAGQTIQAGSNDSLNIKLWEGNIQEPITDNRFIGVLKIIGTDIDSGIIPTGADIECEYEITDAGNITLEVSVPCIGASFNNRNFYSRQEGQIDLDDVDSIAEQGRDVIERIENMEEVVSDEKLSRARKKAEAVAELDSVEICDKEAVGKAANDLLEAKRLISESRQNNLTDIRQMELDNCLEFYRETVKRYADESEERAYDTLAKAAQRSIDRNDADFDNILENMKSKNTAILARQDWFIVDTFQRLVSMPYDYLDQGKFIKLKQLGEVALENDDISALREIVCALFDIRISNDMSDNMFAISNIIKG